MNYKILILSTIIGAFFLEIFAMKKIVKKSQKSPIALRRANARTHPRERKAIEALVELANAKQKSEISLPPKKRTPKQSN